MQPATAPTWDSNNNNREQQQTVNHFHHGKQPFIIALIGLTLYIALMVIGFFLGVCWIQNSLSEMTTAIRELKAQIGSIVLKQS